MANNACSIILLFSASFLPWYENFVEGNMIAQGVLAGKSMTGLEEEVTKNSILLYDKDEVHNVTNLEDEVKEMCKCQVDHLPAIEGFILHYPDGNHLPATKFLSIKGIVLADEDHVVEPPGDEIVEEERLISRMVRKT